MAMNVYFWGTAWAAANQFLLQEGLNLYQVCPGFVLLEVQHLYDPSCPFDWSVVSLSIIISWKLYFHAPIGIINIDISRYNSSIAIIWLSLLSLF